MVALSAKMAAQLIRMSMEGQNQFKSVFEFKYVFLMKKNFFSHLLPYMVILVTLAAGVVNVHSMNMGLQNSQVFIIY